MSEIMHLRETRILTNAQRLRLSLTGPTEVRWQYGRLDNESTTNTLVTNLTIPVGSTAQLVHDAQLDRGACELRAVLESGVKLWSMEDEHLPELLRKDQLPEGVEYPVDVERVGAETGGGSRQTKTMVGSGQFSFEAQYVC